MKKILKQVLAAAMAITCVLQLCAVPGAGAAPVETKYSSVDDIELLSKLGFVSKSNGPKKGEDTVTRAQFANILGCLRGFDENTKNQGTKFMDIPDNYWCAGQIYSLYDVGLISGTSVNTFSPNELITYEQVVKCLVSLLGYEMPAVQAGGYPNGYLKIAAQLGITADASSDVLDYKTVAKLVVKTMDTDIMELTDAGGVNMSLSTSEDETPLNVYNDIYYDTGIMTDNGLTSLTGNAAFFGNAVNINNQVLNINGRFDEYLGYKLKYYYKESGDEQTLLFAIPYKTEVISLKDEDIVFENSDYGFKKIYYDTDTKEKFCKIDDYADVIYNGKAYPEYDLDTLKFNQGDMTLIDNDSDGIYEVIVINEYYNVVVASVDKENGVIYGKYGERVETWDADRVDYITSNGKATNISGLKTNQIISVYESGDEKYKKIVCCSETFTGAVSQVENYVSRPAIGDASAMESFRRTAVNMKITVSEKEYSLSSDFINNAASGYQGIVMPETGLTYTFRFDANGKIAMVESPAGYQYAYLIHVFFLDDNTELGGKTNVRLVLQDGTLTTTVFAKSVTIDGVKYEGHNEGPRGAYNCPEFFNNGKFIRQAVKLKLNNAGEVAEVQTATKLYSDDAALNNDTEYHGRKEKNSYGYNSTKFALCFDGTAKYGGHDQRSVGDKDIRYSLPDDVVIFSLPSDDNFDEKKITVLTESQLADGTSTSWKLYDSDASWSVKLAVTQSKPSTAWNWGGYIIDSVRTEVMEDGTVSKAIVIHDGVGKTKALYPNDDAVLAQIPEDLTRGDICKLVTTGDKLMGFERILSPATQKTTIAGPESDEEWKSYYVHPYSASANGFTVLFDDGKDSDGNPKYKIGGFVKNGTATGGKIYDMEANEVQSARLTDLVSSSPIDENGKVNVTGREMIFFHYRNGWVVSFILIKNIPE